MMPEMDGIELCRKVKQNVNINHIPIIILTAKSSDEDNIKGLSAGADAYIAKPFNIEVVRTTINTIIRERERLRNVYSGGQHLESQVKSIESQTPNDKLLSKIMGVINDNISNPELTVEMITNEVGISRAHLHRKLKELTNQTTRDLIRNVRLQQASKLFDKGHHSVSDVAILTGFSSATYFSTAFKDMYGVAPMQYIEECKQREKIKTYKI